MLITNYSLLLKETRFNCVCRGISLRASVILLVTEPISMTAMSRAHEDGRHRINLGRSVGRSMLSSARLETSCRYGARIFSETHLSKKD